MQVAFVDQGYTGQTAADAAAAHGARLEVVKLAEAKKGFVLLPRRWVVERSFGWAARFRRLARDYERLETTIGGYHWLALASPHAEFSFLLKCMTGSKTLSLCEDTAHIAKWSF